MEREIITFIGPPAAGKSTLMESFDNYYIISTAQLLINAGYDLSSGNYVNDDVISLLMKNKILEIGDGNIILDGFPRTIKQYNSLKIMGIKLSKVYHVDAPYEILLQRAKDRLTCINCHRSYTKNEFKKPMLDGICDICCGKLIERPDDNEITFKYRIEKYNDLTTPLLNIFVQDNIPVCHIDNYNSLQKGAYVKK